MTTLTEFLTARLEEDEKTATAAAELCGCHPPAPVWTHIDDPDDGDRIVIENDPHTDRLTKLKLSRKWHRTYTDGFHAKHIALHDPARVLREVQAKRDLLAHAERSLADADRLETVGAQPADVFTIRAPAEWTLSILAAIYSDHPSYRKEWAA